MAKVLLVEDDSKVTAVIEDILKRNSIELVKVDNGYGALSLGRDISFDLIILDIILPGLDGIGICYQLRKEGIATPIIMLSSRTEVESIVKGLDTGADGYIPKPFSSQELLARVRAMIKRKPQVQESTIILHNMVIDRSKNSVRVADSILDLGIREYKILLVLVENRGMTLSREQINSRTLHLLKDPDETSVDVHVSNLRRKLARHDVGDIVETVYGIGYRVR